MSLNSRLFVGHVYHKRTTPKVHALRYRVFSLLLDLDEIDDLTSRFWLFSRNKFNLLSFYDADFGNLDDNLPNESLVDYIQRSLLLSGISKVPTRILLSCYPRVMGHAFNPLSLFYCHDENDDCFAVVHEVHNTFGERHAYVLPVHNADVEKPQEWIHQSAEKTLFVSPFAHMNMKYRFRLNKPGGKQVIVIQAFEGDDLIITASYKAYQKVLNNSQLLKEFFRVPLLGAKVVGGIHWEALKLWLKGVPFFKHQPKSTL